MAILLFEALIIFFARASWHLRSGVQVGAFFVAFTEVRLCDELLLLSLVSISTHHANFGIYIYSYKTIA